jgi:hypothetical protein
VFPHPDGRMWTQDECDRPLRRISRRAGLPAVSWHVLRHYPDRRIIPRGRVRGACAGELSKWRLVDAG